MYLTLLCTYQAVKVTKDEESSRNCHCKKNLRICDNEKQHGALGGILGYQEGVS
jgi:hypothetical protein